MNAQKLLASIVILLAFTIRMGNAEYDVTKYCQLVPAGTKFPSFETCQKFYICLSSSQVAESSCPANTVFDKDGQTCVSASLSNCIDDVAKICANKDGIWVSDIKDCHIWYYCSKGSIMGSGTCPLGHYFDATAQMCVNGDCYNTGGDGVTEIKNVCHIMQNRQFFGDFNNCAAWHKCSGRNMNSGTCTHGLIYDIEKRMCLPSGENMCAGPAEECQVSTENKQIANPNVCSVYFQCTQSNSLWLWKKIQCPLAQYYDVLLKKCNSRQAATPIESCNRCEYTTKSWVNTVNPDCNTYQTCRNGQEIGKGTCLSNSFFDEQSQMCIPHLDSLPEYRKYNGACHDESGVTTSAPTEEPTKASTDGEESTTAKSEGDGEESTTAKSEDDDDESTTAKTEGDGEESTTAKSESDGEESTTTKSESGGEESTTVKSESDGEDSTTAKSQGDAEESTTAKSEDDSEDSTTTKTEGDGKESTTTKSKDDDEVSTTAKSEGDTEESTTAKSQSNVEESTTAKTEDDGEESKIAKSEGDDDEKNVRLQLKIK